MFGRKGPGTGGLVQSRVLAGSYCGEACGQCGQRDACTMQSGHNAGWHGHASNASVVIMTDGTKGCGHSWGGEHR